MNPSVSSAVTHRLAFFKGLQTLTNRIHASKDTDEIMLELAPELCSLFEVERFTIYALEEGGASIVTRVKTGLSGVQSIRLPIGENSIAGFVALSGQLVNIRDVYDDDELRRISPHLELRREVDANTGFHSRQMLVAPIRDPDTGSLLGVVQLINTLNREPFSKMAEEGLMGLAQTLGVAFLRHNRQSGRLRSRFEALVVDGRITAEEFADATREARENGAGTENVLIEQLGLSQAELGAAAARYFGMPYQPFVANHVKPMDLLRNIKREFVEKSLWLPYEENPEGVVILCVDPEQVRSSGVAQNVLPKKRLTYRVTTKRDFEQTVEQFFGATLDDASVSDLLSVLDDHEEDSLSLKDEVTAAADNELVKLVNKIIIDAYRQGASDIHIEPRAGKEKTQIRFRKDGSLVPYIEIPASYRNPLVTRIKIMCDLDISERRKPQDGKISFGKFHPGSRLELRLATIPTYGGLEDAVLRLLTSAKLVPLDKLGLSPANLEGLKSAIARPYGMVLCVGPTGSGKTTTLHSALGMINKPDRKIWTAEDPIEITQAGLRQVQVNPKIDWTFAKALRAFLRADPDVVMVGEIRDEETAQVAIEASLTGHLVLSTLHTNSAAETVTRLLDMGMDPFNFGDSLLAVLAQRLLRRLCPKCVTKREATDAEVDEWLDDYLHSFADPDVAPTRDALRADWVQRLGDDGRLLHHHAPGCPACDGSGLKGRAAIHELLLVSRDLRRLIQTGGRAEQILAQAQREGMRTLRQDGIEKVIAGMTAIEEVRASSNV